MDLELGGQPVHVRHAGELGLTRAVPLFVHGPPGDGGDWEALLGRTGGIAPDLLGYGRSGKGGHLDLTSRGLAAFLATLLDSLEVSRVSVVAHGWGCAAAVALAAAHPGRVEALTLCSPGGAGRLVDLLTRRGVGELVMGASSRRLMRRWYRAGYGGAEAFPPEHVDAVWEEFDQGTQRAILRLLRERPPTVPEAAAGTDGPRLLVIEGELDPWRETGSGETYPTGHWPWLHPAAAERVVASLTGAA